MTCTLRSILPALFAAALVVGLTGCASPSSSKTTTRTVSASAKNTDSRLSAVAGQPSLSELEDLLARTNGVSETERGKASQFGPYFTRSEREMTARTHEGTQAQRADSRHATLIGLYGELVSEPDRPDALEGRGNISQVSFALDGACFDPAIDNTGQRLAFASTMHGPNANIYIKSVTGTSVTQVTSGTADNVMPVFSPDGQRIAFTSNRDGKWDIYITPVSGGAPVQITSDIDHEIHPTFSPDGTKLAYCRYSSRSGRWEIWVTELDSPGVKRFLDYGIFPQWSPDVASNKILFQRPTQRGSRLHGIWTVDFVNGEAIYPTEVVSAANAAVINPTWSPDGRFIAFATVIDPHKSPQTPGGRPEQSDVWVVRADGSGRARLTDGQFANYQPIWSNDGYVYFVSNRSGVDNIWAIDVTRVVELTQPQDGGFAGVDSGSTRP